MNNTKKVRFNKWTLCAIFCAVILVATAVATLVPFVAPAQAEGEFSPWDGDLVKAGWTMTDAEAAVATAPTSYKPSTGTADKYGNTSFVDINSAEAFAWFARQSSIAGNTFKGVTVRLNCNVDLNNHLWIPAAFSSRKLSVKDVDATKPYQGVMFRGVFDGGNKIIKNLSSQKFYDAITYDSEYTKTNGLSLTANDGANNSVVIALANDGDEYLYGLFNVVGNSTLANFTIKNVKFDFPQFSNTEGKLNGYDKKLQTDAIGTVAAVSLGNITLKNITVGSPRTAQKGSADYTDYITNGFLSGGLVGRLYTGLKQVGGEFIPTRDDPVDDAKDTGYFDKSNDSGGASIKEGLVKSGYDLGTVIAEDCTNYMDVSEPENCREQHMGGLFGYLQYVRTVHVINFKNYGDLTGHYVSGITPVINCQGAALYSKKSDTNPNPKSVPIDIKIDGCSNYGNIRQWGTMVNADGNVVNEGYFGGLVNWIDYGTELEHKDENGQYVQHSVSITNCSNHGDLYSEAAAVGGIVGNVVIGGSGWRFDKDDTGYKGYPSSAFNPKHYAEIVNCFNTGNITAVVSEDENYAANSGHIGKTLTHYVGPIIGQFYSFRIHDACYNKNDEQIALNVAEKFKISGGNTGIITTTNHNADKDMYLFDVSDSFGHAISNSTPSKSRHTIVYYADSRTGLGGNVEKYTTALEDEDWIDSSKLDIEDGVLKGLKAISSRSTSPYGIEIPANVTAIAPHAFVCDTNLKEVSFASATALTDIGEFAFAGTGISNVVLPENLETIGSGAFTQVSVGFNSVTLPTTVTSVGKGAFSNNTQAGKIYEVLVGDNGATSFGTGAFDSDALIIADSRTTYNALLANEDIGSSEQLTYEVTVNYVGKDTTETALFGKTYKLQKVEGSWVETRTSFTGDGFENYVWFTGDEIISGTDYLAKLDALLSQVGVQTIELTGKLSTTDTEYIFLDSSVVFAEDKTYTVNDINSLLPAASAKVTREMTVTINNGTEEVTAIHDAGDYTVSIAVPGKEAPYTVTITVEKQKVSVDSLANWSISAIGTTEVTSALRTGELYLYAFAAATKTEKYPSKHILSATEMGDLALKADQVPVVTLADYARYRASAITISLADNVAFTAGTYSGNVGTEIGMYTATVTLTATANYQLVGDTTVSKTWYVVGEDNYLIAANGSDYAIGNFTFGDSGLNNVALPALAFGTLPTTTAVTLERVSDNKTIGHFTLATTVDGWTGNIFNYYVNSTMPVGEYKITFAVPAGSYTVFEADETETEVSYKAFTAVYTFTVSEASMPTAVVDAVNGVFAASPITVEAGAAITLPTLTQALLLSAQQRNGVWANSDWTVYFDSAATVSYNPANAQNTTYAATVAAIDNPGSYVVYYNLAAKNYTELTVGDRTAYNFSIKVVKGVAIPTVDNVVYTGGSVRPVVNGNALYSVSWNDAQYVNGGNHTVTFTLNQPDYYYWVDSQEQSVSGADAVVHFDITAAANDWVKGPSMLGWTYGQFSVDDNIIVAVSKYIDNGQSIVFAIVDESGNVIDGLSNIKVDANGRIVDDSNHTIANKLNAFNANGKYYLKATLAATANYQALESRNFAIAVAPAETKWETSLGVNTWVEGAYDKAVEDNGGAFPIVALPTHGTVTVKITDTVLTDEEGNFVVYYNGANGTDELAEVLRTLPLGKYMIVASVAGTSNYTGLTSEPLFFDVFEAPGLPWWGTLLIAVGSVALVVAIFLILWKTGVFRIITDKILIGIKTRVSVEATLASVRAAKRNEEAARSLAKAEAAEKAEERAKARKEAKAAYDALSPEQKAALEESKAQETLAKADKMRQKAEAIQAKAEKIRSDGDKNNK